MKINAKFTLFTWSCFSVFLLMLKKANPSNPLFQRLRTWGEERWTKWSGEDPKLMVTIYQSFSWFRLYVSLQFPAINFVFIKPLMKVNLQLQELLIFLKVCDLQSLFVFVFVLIQFARSKPRRSKSPNENIFANKTKLFEKVRGVHEREAKKKTSVSSNLCNQAENLSLYSDFQLFSL